MFVARQYIDQICKAKILNRYQISDIASYVKSPLSMVFSKDMRLAVL
jgi:hypothetical protein